MKANPALLGVALAISGLAPAAQSSALNDYIAVRRQNGVVQASSSEALLTFVGKRVIEVKATVRGSIGSEGNVSVILALENGRTVTIRAEDVPEWMRPANSRARLLINAERETEFSSLRATLIAAIPETMIAAREKEEAAVAERNRQAEEARRAAAAARPATPPPTSRAGTRPPSMPGDIPNVRTAPSRELPANLLNILPAYTDFIQSRNRRLSRAQAQNIAEGILTFSVKYGVDARLIVAIVLVESNFNPNAVSHAGARGLGQLMPGTARELGVNNVFDTDQNLSGTVRLITSHIDRYSRQGNDELEALVLALAAYNAGPGAVRRHGGVPPFRETQNYVRKVIATYRELCGLED